MTSQSEFLNSTPADWIEKYFYIPYPRDPVSGELMPAGPIRLADHQRRIINAALKMNDKGLHKYSSILYSAPKKSGKSAIASAVTLWKAWHSPNSYVACLANKGTQGNDRIFLPIKTCFRLHRQLGGIFKDVEDNEWDVTLPNFTVIKPIPVNASGEAGSEPICITMSEVWGFIEDSKKRLWTEMTLPPTLYGKAIRWVESYAGFEGESDILQQQYELGVKQGSPHPDFLDLIDQNGNLVVFENEAARMFVYWDTVPRMVWQTPEYYAAEAMTLPASEFDRVHRNQWVTATSSFIDPSWWDSAHDSDLPSLKDGNKNPVVVGIDAAVSRDCAALVAVTRHPTLPGNCVAVRGVKIFYPDRRGGIIKLEDTIGETIKQWSAKWNVVCWVYDPMQMEKLAQDYTKAGYGWFLSLNQGGPRAISDKQLHDMIMHRQITWSSHTTEGDVGYKELPGETLYNHITKAGAEKHADDSGSVHKSTYRLVKLSANSHIDAAVALSMATYQALKLAIDNSEYDQPDLIKRLQRGEISVEEFTDYMKRKRVNG